MPRRDAEPYAGKLADPEWRRERARKASAASHSLDTQIRRIVDSAPALTGEQIARLRALLPPPARLGDCSDPVCRSQDNWVCVRHQAAGDGR